MIPDFICIPGAPWDVLPSGMHPVSFADIKLRFGFNQHRRTQLDGLKDALSQLVLAGCRTVYLDGSFVTSKPLPEDYDCCWDHVDIDPTKLNPVFRDFSNKRAAQKAAFLGKFFPAAYPDAGTGLTFLELFQIEKHTGIKKGILLINLTSGLVV